MRTVTYSLQSVLGKHPVFPLWYKKHRTDLKNDSVCRFFHKFRNINLHIGENIVSMGSSAGNKFLYWFISTHDLKEVPSEDVASASRKYFLKVLSIVYDCYIEFGPEIDAHQRYTAEYFSSISKSIEDAEEEMGYPRGWTDIGDKEFTKYRWQLLRDNSVGCEINNIFQNYLGKKTPISDRLPDYSGIQKGKENQTD